ncbi:hypothetical protein LRP49_22995 [Enterovibrio sp. ZSDZ35]|uniref:Serine aminopeptidase S33 domain-containing protein n=1 Tax=Enterovibrio qingdaonensis TaxID=2899818 RepID=A0ABT5QST2_9GAMM|nr:hypothetical protein [Enterovibrio sp. ZSDZ35]MDD1784044.1 hypothetical protein [Enterovibrio sp. ZSDZ35]
MQVDKLVLVATPAKPMSETLIRQYRERAPHFADDVEVALESIKNGEALTYPNKHIEMMFRPSAIPYLASCFFIDPTRIAKSLNQTVHVIQGDNDIQVGAENGEIFREALGERARVTRCEGMNHVLVKTPRELEENMASYNNPLLPLHHQLERAILTDFKINKII